MLPAPPALAVNFCAGRPEGTPALSPAEQEREPEYDPDQLRTALAGAGLELCGWHIEWRHLQPGRLDATIRYLEAAGNRNAVVPCLGGRWQVAPRPGR